VPLPDDQSEPFWRAAADHVLTLARCSACGAFAHPPDVVCPHCGTTAPNFVFTPVSGDGVVRVWTVMRQSFLPGFEADLPFVLVDVELDLQPEGGQPELRLIGRLLDGVDAPLRPGARVRVAWEDIGPDVSVPAFRLVSP
jgi:uncharacterized OB-fold protein